MFLADVIGSVVTPVQIPDLEGRKQLLVRPVTPAGEPTARVRVALDELGAGPGDRVLVMDEGNSGRQLLGLPDAGCRGIVRAVVVGIVDAIDLESEVVYDHRTA